MRLSRFTRHVRRPRKNAILRARTSLVASCKGSTRICRFAKVGTGPIVSVAPASPPVFFCLFFLLKPTHAFIDAKSWGVHEKSVSVFGCVGRCCGPPEFNSFSQLCFTVKQCEYLETQRSKVKTAR